MKFETTASFEADYRSLKITERKLFRAAVQKINSAYIASKTGHSSVPRWPAKLRIRDVTDAMGIFEVTWSFSGPDGRATFEYFNADGEVAIRWRRIGDHRIFKAT